MHIHLLQADIIWERPTENRNSLEKMFKQINPTNGWIHYNLT